MNLYANLDMRFVSLTLITILFCSVVGQGFTFEFNWEIDETPEGSESATVVEPVQVVVLDEAVAVPSYSASLALMRKYSVHLTPEWSQAHAYRLLQTFESIPKLTNNSYEESPNIPASVWRLINRYLLNGISIEYHVGFTEIVRFEIVDESKFDLNADGEVNILDLVIVANAIGESDSKADVNGDGVVNILDLVQIENHI